MTDDERVQIVVMFFDNAHGGPGWYYWEIEYPEEGSCGPFATRDEAVAYARTAGPVEVIDGT